MASRRQHIPKVYEELIRALVADCGSDAIGDFIRRGVDVNYRDVGMGRNPLFVAVACDCLRAVNSLLAHGADPNQRTSYRSPVDGREERGRTPLHYAKSGAVVKALLAHGADVNVSDAAGNTPLICAAVSGNTSVVEALLAAGVHPLARQHSRKEKAPATARELVQAKLNLLHEIFANSGKGVEITREYEKIGTMLARAESAVGSD